jgi:hypothetical protein
MNYPNILEEITNAELEGFHRGLLQGRNEALACSIRDRASDWNAGHSRGIVVGSVIGAFLLAAGELALAVIFL